MDIIMSVIGSSSEHPPTPNFDSLAPRSSSSSSSSSSVHSFVVRRRQQRQRQRQQRQQKADGKYCITGGNDRTVRLWNPTRADPACGRRGLDRVHRNPSSSSSSSSSSLSRVLSSQEYHGGQRPTRTGPPPDLHDDNVDPSSWRDNLPSALPMQTYADGHVHPVRCASTNRSSTVLLSASDKTLLATDLVTAQAMRKWWGHEARIEYVACLGGDDDNNVDSAGGGGGGGVGEGIYASASYDSTVRLWDARSRSQEPLMMLGEAKDAVTCVSAARGMGEARIATSSVDGKMRTYDLRTARLVTEDASHPITSFSLSNDGSSVAASCLDGIVRLWGYGSTATGDGDDQRRKRKVYQKLHSFHECGNYKVECAFTSDGEHVVSGSECGAVAVYPVDRCGDGVAGQAKAVGRRAKATALRGHEGPTCSVAACPQPSRPWLILSASYDGTAVVWASREQHDCCIDG